VFKWTPAEDQGPNSYTFTVKVTDSGSPAMWDDEQITVTVAEVNKAPTVAPIGPKTVNEGVALSFTATATDPDVPANSLTFSLVSGAPATATIDPVTGAFSWTPPNGPATVNITVRATDNGSPALYDDETFTVTVNNVAPTATFTAPAGPLNEGQPIVVSFSNPMDVPADLGAITYAYDCGTGYGAATTSVTATCSAKDNPNQVVKGKVIDHTGDFTEYTRTILVDNVAPVLGAMTISPNAVIQVNTTITASAPFTDAGVNDTHTGTFVWDDATANTSAGITEMNGSGTASATHKYTAPGVYEVVLTLRDKDGAEVGTTYQYVVVYDPSGGFVTGGGWIDSPANACQLTPTCKPLTGKANFGFVSKYKKGQSTPEGNTEFQFKAGDINFHSEVYEWLVVAGARSQFKGTGTINGSGYYGFMLTAVDGQVSGGGGTDKFRIKIWDKNDGDRVVYDNQLLSADDAAPTTVLGGGSINIQAK
jgi:PKD repeat protein